MPALNPSSQLSLAVMVPPAVFASFPDWLSRFVQPTWPPKYQVPGPLGGTNSCACASAQLNATASATPAPSRKRFLIPYLRPQKTRLTMVAPHRWTHDYHPLLRWQ